MHESSRIGRASQHGGLPWHNAVKGREMKTGTKQHTGVTAGVHNSPGDWLGSPTMRPASACKGHRYACVRAGPSADADWMVKDTRAGRRGGYAGDGDAVYWQRSVEREREKENMCVCVCESSLIVCFVTSQSE
jgi:hypothetical protein